jgi:predicted membrane-bound spermidine synthase
MLAIFSGADVYSATIIVAAFMAGLGIGHLAGGHVADKVSRRWNLVLFGVAEIAIAVFAVFSAALYYGYFYRQLGDLDWSPSTTAILLFGGLLWPTFFMGASLPLLARGVTDRVDRAARTVGALYGFNTLGAATGAAIATWVLLPRLGLEGSLRVGAMLNCGCALVLIPFAFRFDATVVEGQAGPEGPPYGHEAGSEHDSGRFPFWLWALAYGLAGFVALSYEIVWFRLLGVMMKSTAFTFGTLLTVYLSGLGIGAAIGSAVSPRTRRPGLAFFACQTAACLSAALLLAFFVGLADDARAFRGYFASYEPLSVRDSVQALRSIASSLLEGTNSVRDAPANFLRLYVMVPVLLVMPPTMLMGLAFPFLQRVVHSDVHHIGRRVGMLLVANVFGCILGTILTGWLSLATLGSANTLKLLVGVSGLFALGMIVLGERARSVWAGAAVSLTIAGAMLVMPDAGVLWARLHGTTADRIIFGEDNSGLSVIRGEGEGGAGPKVVFVNGMGQSVLPYGEIHTVLGALPALVHPNPRNIAIIGLGSGDTVYAAASRAETTRVVCIEIIRPQLATLRTLADRDPYEGLRALLRDPRVVHEFGDGRAFLMRNTEKFDIIEADALRPTSAYSGNLYSEAYFTLVRSRLKPNGLAATWVPTVRISNTFVKVFPYVVQVPGVLIGSNEPFEIEPTAIAQRLADPRIRDHYRRAGIDIEALITPYMNPAPVRIGPEFDRTTLVDVNTDLFPKDEYDLTRP